MGYMSKDDERHQWLLQDVSWKAFASSVYELLSRRMVEKLDREIMQALSQDDAQYQADKLVEYVRRGGNAARWWQSKGFSKADRAAIIRAAKGGG